MLFGYLDPGTGSMIVSAVVGAIGAIALFFKMSWRRFTGLFSFWKRSEKEEQPSEEVA